MSALGFVVVANLRRGDAACKKGAKCYVTVVHGWPCNCRVLVRSRGGRWVRRAYDVKWLENRRVKQVYDPWVAKALVGAPPQKVAEGHLEWMNRATAEMHWDERWDGEKMRIWGAPNVPPLAKVPE